MLYLLRWLERWLHQHIFKVGWLLTKQYQTTTILYYAFFLPGIFLYELTYWLMAGFLNVRADRAVAWPQKQEIGQLKLNFVKLSKNVDPIRLAIISVTPLIAGLAAVSYIATNILNLQDALGNMQLGILGNLTATINQLTAAPDFWLWIYLAFTISNTMMPDIEKLRGWRIVAGILVVIAVVLWMLGASGEFIVEALRGPIANGLNALSSTLVVIILLDFFAVGVLGLIEAITERITGDSATFKEGKMVTMRRSEWLKLQAEQHAASRKKSDKALAAPGGPPSIYKLPLPIPGAPGKEPVTRDEGIVISPSPAPALASSPPPARLGPSVIAGTTAEKPGLIPSAENKPSVPAATPKPSLPPPNPRSLLLDNQDESEDDDLTYDETGESL